MRKGLHSGQRRSQRRKKCFNIRHQIPPEIGAAPNVTRDWGWRNLAPLPRPGKTARGPTPPALPSNISLTHPTARRSVPRLGDSLAAWRCPLRCVDPPGDIPSADLNPPQLAADGMLVAEAATKKIFGQVRSNKESLLLSEQISPH